MSRMVIAMNYLKKADCNADRIPGAPQRTPIVCYWPWIAGKGFQDTCELEFDLLDG